MITIAQEPGALYPAYNDAFIKFSSDISPTYAEVIPADTVNFPNAFLLYPDSSGNFLFNIKELAKASFSNPEFSRNGYTPFTWGQSFQDNKVSVQVTIKTYSDTTNDSVTKTYTFYKEVIQIGQPLISNYILSPSKNGVDYIFKYWKGFPFDFQLKDLAALQNVTVKNVSTGVTSAAMTTQQAGSFALHVDTGASNWTDATFLPLINRRSELEVYQESVFKANVVLLKEDDCEGWYLRWYNNNGGFNYWLFDQHIQTETKVKSGGDVAKNTFLNAGSADAPFLEYGKTAKKALRLKTTVEKALQDTFEGLYTSPNVELYSAQTPGLTGSWSSIRIDGAITKFSKRENTEYNIIIDLPELITLTR